MKRILLIISSALVLHCTSSAQDGKLISRDEYVFADSTIAKLSKVFPETKEVLDDVSFSSITYLSDGLKVKGYMAEPKKAGRYPCVIYNRGGNRTLGALSERNIMRFLGVISSWGYVVVGSQYRGNDGGEGVEEFGGKDVNDVLNLITLLGYIDKADTSRIGMYGWSRGGMMTYSALTKTNRIKAAIVGSGLADAFASIRERPDLEAVYVQLVPDYKETKEAALRSRSAVQWADKINKATPLLIMHGSSDWRVAPDQAFTMTRKLYEHKHPFRFVMFEGGEHSLMEHYDEVNRLAKDFLNRYVRDGKEWPSMLVHGD